ncbi:vacuolar sorting protein [Trichoderma longibrachiatum ATCC 18648]|uniref:non-specific serine/threonine protein kinase n=1 Tax=Trichoderma longibrachiatum ATCC 18648 TaxID=983965 RepID=A0A2T4BUM9_TRILO|nr:vacuolar sorting protein [Trichoderma longibrachiatum ATCC 18648]
MGQGFSLATPSAGAAGIDIAQLQDIQYEKSIGNARFMKSIRGRHEHGVVLVKVLVKPYTEVKLDKYKKKIIEQRKALAGVPNALGFQRIIETETNGYLVRQFMYSSLYDRMSTRPFLVDIFSAGCVIAQLFLESEIFSLAQLYKYRRGEYDPVITHLSVISDKDVRDMIAHMIQLDPERRYSAEQYLDFWKDKVFPGYFYSFLHQYMEVITDPSSGNGPISGAERNLGESDNRIDRIFNDFDKISYFLGYQTEKQTAEPIKPKSRLGLDHFPVRLSIPSHEHAVSADLEPPEDDGTLIFLTLVVSAMRTTARAASRIRACDLLLAFAERLTDEAKLDRVLPYLMTLLRKEETDMVLVTVIRAVTQLLQLVRMTTPINSHVLVEYVLPRMEIALGTKSWTPNSLVRATYASCIGSLATTAQRFLEMASSLRADGSMPITDPEVEPGTDGAAANFESMFDNANRQLFEILESHTKQLVEDPDVHVRRAFLTSVPELCMYFQENSNDILLTHLITYLNDRDWMLKSAFLDTIVGIGAFIGGTSLEEFILPLMIQALADPEETVVRSALHSLAQLAGLGLLSRPKIWELTDLIGRLTMHPNMWIRESSAEFLSMAAKFLSKADVQCILLPLARPYLKIQHLSDFSELNLLDSLKRPLPRAVFDQALTWASKTDKGIFWKSVLGKRMSSSQGALTSAALIPSSTSKISRNEEDEQWLEKLRNFGLKPEDEMKFLALCEYIARLSSSKARDAVVVVAPAPEDENMPTGFVQLKELGVTIQTVFFDDTPLKDPSAVMPNLEPTPPVSGPYTIADALLDASMTIDDTLAKKKRAALNSHKRVHSIGPLPSRSTGRLLSPAGSDRASSIDSRALNSPLAPGDDAASYSSRRGIRHQSSALSLLDRRDGHKSIPEIGTSDANAFGEVEGPFTQTLPAQTISRPATEGGDTARLRQVRHSYEGTDPHVRRMLDNMYVENFPRDVLEFGPMVQPISGDKSRSVNAPGADPPWKPKGNLVATFAEHRGPINRVIASPDHVFFITGGNDGTVKVWDTQRLERNITNRSRQTYKHGDGARVVALCFVENSHCFVSCASDGSVHVVKVDTVPSSGIIRYTKLRVLREYQLPEGEYAVWCEHFKQEQNSVLIIATNLSRILAMDLRTMALLYVLENPVHHGTPTCFCVDKKRNWLCVGTSHGVIDLWDLRFKMRLKGWGVPGKGSIYRLCVHPTKGRGKWICVAGGTGQGEVTVWDLEKMTCREIYRTGGSKDGPKGYTPWEVDEDKPEGMLGRFATNLEMSDVANADRGVRAMVVGTGTSEESREVRHAFMLTGGSDKRLRFWDISRIENSCIYSGLQPDEQAPTYTSSHPTTSTTLNTERFARNAASAPNAGTGSRQKAPRSTVISMQQQQLLKSHLDLIMDVAILEYPYSMSVSVDRSGVVYVFQ